MGAQPILRMYRIHWVDIVRTADPWISAEAAVALRPADCYSVGWLIYEDDECVVLASTLGDSMDEDIGGTFSVPRCVIKSITELVATGAGFPAVKRGDSTDG